MRKNKRYKIEVSEDQLRMIINCVEDCHRFIGGQMELQHTTDCLNNWNEVQEELKKLHPLVAPNLPYNGSYGWNGGSCPNKNQKEFLQASYYLYRELLHQWTLMQDTFKWNVYRCSTLRCEGSGEKIKLELIKE